MSRLAPAACCLLLAGLLVGPHGLRLIDDAAEVEILAEVGVSLLLFGIGLDAYWDQFEGLRDRLTGYQARTARGLEERGAEVVDVAGRDGV